MHEAFDLQDRTGSTELHRRWIETLLVQYYDPMYEYQLSKRRGDVRARGNREEIIAQANLLARVAA